MNPTSIVSVTWPDAPPDLAEVLHVGPDWLDLEFAASPTSPRRFTFEDEQWFSPAGTPVRIEEAG